MVDSSTMQTTIDGAGRLVIPKRIRDHLGLRAGDPLEVQDRDGEIRIAKARRTAALTDRAEGILAADLDPPLAVVTPQEVRDALERMRR